jgi:hypothetical protein
VGVASSREAHLAPNRKAASTQLRIIAFGELAAAGIGSSNEWLNGRDVLGPDRELGALRQFAQGRARDQSSPRATDSDR